MITLKLIVYSGLFLFLILFFGNCQNQTSSITVPVTVKVGDTLDSIIIKLANQYGDNRDYREIRYYAAEDNNKHNKNIFPGEVLKIRLEIQQNEKDR